MFRRPARSKTPRGAVKSRTQTLPAPVRGWNARDGLAAMHKQDAVLMDNMFPDATAVSLRKGSVNHTTGITGTVESFLPYNSGAGKKLFAAAGTVFKDATSAGAVGASVVTGLTNARWESVNFTTSGGTFLVAVNGTDSLREYDGTTWTAITGVSVPAITGLATTSLSNVAVAHSRLWFVQKDSLSAWYLPVNSIAGALTEFPLGAIFASGGTLVAIGSWTLDSGTGLDDLTVFFSSEGELAIYRGTDPSSASTWSKQGLYKIGKPVGKRCMAKFASDLILLTEQGLFPLSKAIATAELNTKSALTDRIQSALRDAVTSYGHHFGWETTVYDSAGLLLINVPINATGTAYQYVMNTITGAWCRFLSWNAATFAVFDGELYFGTSTVTTKAWTGGSDNNAQIVGDCLQAFGLLGSAAAKQCKLAQVLLGLTGPCGYYIDMRANFDVTRPSALPSLTTGSFSLWGTALWGTGVWGGGEKVFDDWKTVFGLGRHLAPWLRLVSKDGSVNWYSTNFLIEDGTAFG